MDAGELPALLSGPPRPLSLRESARVLGGLRHVELSAFSRLGEAATSGSLPARAAALSSAASMGHAWRAAQLEALLPVSAGLADEAWTASPGEAAEAALEELATAPLGEREGFYHGLEEAYRRRLTHTQEATDGAVFRTLRRLCDDVIVTRAQHVSCQDNPGGRA